MLLTNTQVPRLSKAFTNSLSANIKLSKTQLIKMVQLGEYLSTLLNIFDKTIGPVIRAGLEIPGIIDRFKAGKSIPKALLDTVYSLVDNKTDLKTSKILMGSGKALTSNEKKDIEKVIRSLEKERILFKGTTGKVTSQEGRFPNFFRQLMTADSPLTKSVLPNWLKVFCYYYE